MQSTAAATPRLDLIRYFSKNRPARRAAVAAVHTALWAAGFTVAMLLRYEGDFPAAVRAHCLPLLGVLMLARLVAFHSLRLFDGLFRYGGFRELERIVAASSAATLVALG